MNGTTIIKFIEDFVIMRWAGHVARMRGGERRAQGFGGKTRGKETTGETQA
jgi:hypothetical protein